MSPLLSASKKHLSVTFLPVFDRPSDRPKGGDKMGINRPADMTELETYVEIREDLLRHTDIKRLPRRVALQFPLLGGGTQ